MRFSLQDIRKSVQRRGGKLAVSLHFLRGGECQDEIARLVTYYESLLGQPQRLFAQDEARAIVGEYRLAYCLMATLSHWYSWRSRAWNETVAQMGGSEELLALGSPVQLRLSLYTHINEHYHGFLGAEQRAQALQLVASRYALSTGDLEYLLALDSEDEAILTRDAELPPTVEEVTTLYNQWTFEAALFNASSVHFVIDVMAFNQAENQQAVLQTPSAGVGAVIKRLCFLARRLGVYYDLEYEQHSQPSLTGPAVPPLLHLTLYGPQEVTGAPQQYGLRLARLCRFLLGYSQPSGVKKPQLTPGIVEAEARVHFLQRAYTFAMDAKLLQLLPRSGDSARSQTFNDPSQLFDSSIEQNFSEAFFSLARNHGVDGWQLEREQEPLLLDKGIFLPDFALTRGRRRIYFEILGFWTPAYRERKIQKLQYLRGRKDLVLAIPEEARDAFSPIAADFPVVYYQGQLSVMDVLQLLQEHYDDFADRLKLLDVAQIQRQVQQQGFIAERQCYPLLHCYRRSELQQAVTVSGVSNSTDITFVAGLGLYAQNWLAHVRQAFLSWLEKQPGGTAVWHEALQELRCLTPDLQQSEDATLETLVSLWDEVRIQRASIFEVTIELQAARLETAIHATPPDTGISSDKELRRPVRERRAAIKKRPLPPPEIVQGDLWG
ncbi:DUF790 family protein [Dictyobacter aurantiacus]|uniref:DUF790 domain-containing protein n=1 Tax=Dictyobacter aurantiacus TaxID=1936993 RepID=A0A401ZB00_9CHLR|nr:DUF790 family protein [Dictyobacter aurantiacus]GCE04060.1 hypothetical protein KDAU_13890 [Dictyobacter aurantiacus]